MWTTNVSSFSKASLNEPVSKTLTNVEKALSPSENKENYTNKRKSVQAEWFISSEALKVRWSQVFVSLTLIFGFMGIFGIVCSSVLTVSHKILHPREYPAPNFSLKYQPWIKHQSHEIKGNDHQLKKVMVFLLLNKFSSSAQQWMCRE